jgi:hypothetical protein
MLDEPAGDGLQGVYLTEISRAFAETLAGLIGIEARPENLIVAPARGIDEWEHKIQRSLETGDIPDTVRTAHVQAGHISSTS